MNLYCQTALKNNYHIEYHNTEYGFPVDAENLLTERLALEIFQAGLSWLTILKKRAQIFVAFEKFDIDKIASYTNEDIERLLNDPGIIRNITKIKAIIFNAQKIQKMRDSHHGFSGWLHSHHPQKKKNGSLFLKKLLSLRATR